jgi:protein-tyrosine kinase
LEATDKKKTDRSIKNCFARLSIASKFRSIYFKLKNIWRNDGPESIEDTDSVISYFDRQFDSTLKKILKDGRRRSIKATGRSIISYFGRLPIVSKFRSIYSNLKNIWKDGRPKSIKEPGRSIINYLDQPPIASEFRSIYFNLKNIWKDDRPRSILLSSSSLGEGKSTIASLLAIALSSYGERMTLLIDADLRRPCIHKLFDIRQSPGLAELLLGEAGTEEVLNSTPLNNLKIITSGRQIEKVCKPLKSETLKNLFAQFKLDFGYVVIDTPPIIPVPDSLILSRQVDGVILVLKAGSTPREVVKRAYDLLQNARGKSIGIILNNMKKALPYYYNYGYYGYRSSKRKKG